jgi:methyl-accepting chemotaxis protein
VTSLRARWLPEGRGLPYDTWTLRHRAIVNILWLHVPFVVIFGLVRGFSPAHVALDGSILVPYAVAASMTRFSQMVRTMASTLGLLTSSAVLVHLAGGSIEMHFHFFVMIGVITLYQDWRPFLAGILFVALHHGIMGTAYPHGVFNHSAAWNNPWEWASIHALFILGASAAYITGWRYTEIERKRAEHYGAQLAETELLQREALEINDNIVQGLIAVEAAMDFEDEAMARDALNATLDAARAIVTGLLQHAKTDGAFTPGDLRRDHPSFRITSRS